jgi:hypothetical protein
VASVQRGEGLAVGVGRRAMELHALVEDEALGRLGVSLEEQGPPLVSQARAHGGAE